MSNNAKISGLVSLTAIALSIAAPAFAQSSPQSPGQSSSSASSSAAAPAPAAQPQVQPQTQPQTQAGNAAGNTGPGDSTTITITATKPEVQHKADRDVYDTKQDPQSATGTASDVLNNVPAVTVDPDGTVALRGNTNVQVYVNGKKSTAMQGDSRAFTLQSLSGDDIDSVEVMANPSAAFGADTTGGIINIVLKRGRSIKPQTSLNVTAGDRGRGSFGFQTGFTVGKLTLNNIGLRLNAGAGGAGAGGGGRGGGGGGGGGNASSKNKSVSDRITLDPTTGTPTREDVSHGVSKSNSHGLSANVGGTYNLSDSDSIDGDFRYTKTEGTQRSASENQSYTGSHVLTQDYANLRDSSRANENMNFGLNYDHRGEIGSTEDFKMGYQHSQSLSENFNNTHNLYHFTAAPVPGTDTYSASHSKTKSFSDEFSGDWSHPVATTDDMSSQIQIGWDVYNTINDRFNYRSQTSTSPVMAPFLPRSGQVTQFNTNDLTSAAYITWQQQWAKFGYNIGVRVENFDREIESQDLVPTAHPNTPDPVNKAEINSVSYTPSMFLLYNVTEKDHLKFIFSRKIQRPSADQLNPVIVYSDDLLTANSGNAGLKDATRDGYELDYYHDVTRGNISAQLYYNQIDGTINQIQSYIASPVSGGAPVLLTSWDNLGSSRQTGVSLNYGGSAFNQKVRFNFNGDLSNTVIVGFDNITHLPLHTDGANSRVSGMVRYTVDPKNSLGVNLQYSGKRGDNLGYTTPSSSLNLFYMYQVIPNKAIITVNATNFIFGPLSKRVTNTSITRSFDQSLNPGASFTVSFRYTFGAVRQPQNGDGGFRRGQGGPGGQGGQGGYRDGPGGGYGGGGGGFGGGPGPR
ncbi:MAG TPA: TonB-dependent receptor [Asticcacaulis sp.]|nr:TonB-dependent receptor [Asticcacaulis sp.]